MNIKLFAGLRDTYPVPEGFQLDAPAPVSEVLRRLKIPESKAAIVMINGKHAAMSTLVSPSDTLAVFPPLGGG